LTLEEVKSLYNAEAIGITRIPDYGEVVVKMNGYSSGRQIAYLIILTPTGGIIDVEVPFSTIKSWTPYTGPFPPQIGPGMLPGGMGGQGWGAGQAFPPYGGGSGSGWGSWGRF
jgi:hypothetical protein